MGEMDWAWFSTPLGLAVIAPVGAFLGALLGIGITSWTTRSTNSAKIEADFELAKRKIDADVALAERKVRLDREFADWKRRTELAEQVLADFYKARDIFLAARSPFAFPGEGASRPREPGEVEDEARGRDAIYAPYERLSRERDFLTELHAKRFRFMALFGNEAGMPFMPFIQIYNQIGNATRALLNDRRHLSDDMRTKFEMLIGWTMEEEDPIKQTLDQAVVDMEALCRPVLEVRPV